MNRTPSGFLILEKAIQGFLQYKIAEGLSPRSIVSYRRDLKLWHEHSGVEDVGKVTSGDLTNYIAWLRTEYSPQRFNGNTDPLSKKNIRNHWVTLSSFFRWFSEEFQTVNPMKKVPATKFEKKPVHPYTKDEIEALLHVCKYS
ncbi:MAG: hypothetical protein FVQ83_06215 [Chloroflexi bacterium]|nr:hypothetical protein [Chloroflexota bacterium]